MKHWRPEPGNVVPLRTSRRRGRGWTRAGDYVGGGSRGRQRSSILLCAVLIASIAAYYWPAAKPVDAPRSAPIVIDTQTADVLDEADVEWEQRAYDGAEERPSTGSGRTHAVPAAFGFCRSGGGSHCVVDGDTFHLGGEKVRIAGIDAPETHPPRCAAEARLGEAATQQLHALLNSGAVTMSSIDRDRDSYGRLLRNVAVDGADVGEAMIAAGLAREYAGGRRSWCA